MPSMISQLCISMQDGKGKFIPVLN